MWKRLLLALVMLGIAVVLFEGAWTLVTGEPSPLTLRHLHPRVETATRMGMLDEERMRAAALTEGPYDQDVDPLVGGRFKAGLDRKLFRGTTHTDRWGQRVRPGPPPADGARRIVVLGDSVAFGFGVDDDETFGHRLETWLATNTKEGMPGPAVWTVACPGWNTASEVRYLLNHLDRLDPDLVILVPVENDLDDLFGVDGLGHRKGFIAEPGLPPIGIRHHVKLFMEAYDRLPLAVRKAHHQAGGRDVVAPAMLTGFAPESQRRWAKMFQDVGNLERRLADRGARLCVAHLARDTFAKAYGVRIRDALPQVPRTVLIEKTMAEDTLGEDPHGNADFLDLCARVMATWLVEQRWLPEIRDKPSPAGEVAERRRAEEIPAATARAWLDDLMKRQETFSESFVDMRNGTGFHQIYGGIDSDGAFGMRGLVALKREDAMTTLRVHMLRLPASESVYPLSIDVRANGTRIGTVDVARPDHGDELLTHFDLALPEALHRTRWIDVLAEASNWTVQQRAGVSRIISCRIGFEFR